MAVANIWESIDVLQRRGKLSEELFSLHFEGFTELIQSRKKQSTHESKEDSQECQSDEDIDTGQGIENLVDEVEDSGHEDSEAEFRERVKVVNSREGDDDTGWREDSEMDDSKDADRHTEKQTKTSEKSIVCPVFTQQDRALFLKQYESMAQINKWKLKSGRYVEDVMYALSERCQYHHLLHSFIFDINDEFTCSGFTEEELDEINKENTNDLPDLKPELLDFIYTFAKTSTAEIREELNQPHARLGEAYDPTTDYVYDHIKTTVADWVRLLEKTPNPLALNMPEQWYRTNLWRSIDIAFGDIPYVFVVGGERAGIATAERKNRHRTLGNEVSMLRKQIGKKGDGFVRSLGSRPTDWAASEAGAHWEGEKGTKLLKEGSFSLPRQLKDIFSTLARRVNFDKDKIRQLNVPGFIHAGAIIINANLDNPRGYVCRYAMGLPCEVYAEVEQFPKSLDALVTILYAKATISRTMAIVNSLRSNEIRTWWNRLGKKGRESDGIALPDCHPTPKKSRKMDPKVEVENKAVKRRKGHVF